MDTLQFGEELKMNMLKVVSAVLNLGNVLFRPMVSMSGEPAAEVRVRDRFTYCVDDKVLRGFKPD